MTTKESYEKKLQAQLDEWKAEIDKLRARAEGAQADAQIEYERQIEDLQALQESANRRLLELKEAGDEAWEDLRAGAQESVETLGQSIRSAMERFL